MFSCVKKAVVWYKHPSTRVNKEAQSNLGLIMVDLVLLYNKKTCTVRCCIALGTNIPCAFPSCVGPVKVAIEMVHRQFREGFREEQDGWNRSKWQL